MASHLDRSKTVTNAPLGGDLTKRQSRNINELRPESSESKLVKTEPDRAARLVAWADQPQADDSVGCQSPEEHLLS